MLTPLQREHLVLIVKQVKTLDPQEVLRDARNPNSPLHSLFVWDDAAAAEAYRLVQAHKIVRVMAHLVPQRRREPIHVVARSVPASAPPVSHQHASPLRPTLAGLIIEAEALKIRYATVFPAVTAAFANFLIALRRIDVAPITPMRSRYDPIDANFDVIERWAREQQPPVQFKDWDDLPKVNARRERGREAPFKRMFARAR